MCTDPVFLNALCSIYPVHFMKTVRLAVNLTRPLLLDRTFDDVKVLYLVRDPRATLNSRKSRDFCAATPSCIKAESLCSDLVDDFYSLIELQNAFPGRIK
jgi:carbohydrate 6-sulfotransferase 6